MKNETKQLSIVEYMNNPSIQENIEKTLRDRTPQFIASVAALVNSSPSIAKCERKSILSSCLTAAALDLPINQNLGFAYIVPYKVKVTEKIIDSLGKEITKTRYEYQAQFQIGAKGFKQLAIRTEKYNLINDTDIRDGEFLGVNISTGEYEFSEDFRKATPKYLEERKNLEIIGYLSYFKLNSGFSKQLYMTIDELKKHGLRYSKSYSTGNWTNDFDSMARKTVIKLLISKHGLMTSQLQKAVEADQAVVTEKGMSYIDNQPVDPSEVAHQKEREKIAAHIGKSKTIKELCECEEYLGDYDSELSELFDKKLIILNEKENNKKG